MIILVGKAVKLSIDFLNADKEYVFEILLGVSSSTQDLEGKIKKINNANNISDKKITKVIDTFPKQYKQDVPIYSSAKINGIRLRELCYASDNMLKYTKDKISFVKFKINKKNKIYKKLTEKRLLNNIDEIIIKIPTRKVFIKELNLLDINIIKEKLYQKKNILNNLTGEYKLIKLKAVVSKGTYIRQMAEDIGQKAGNTPALLYSLKRTKIGNISSKDCITLKSLNC